MDKWTLPNDTVADPAAENLLYDQLPPAIQFAPQYRVAPQFSQFVSMTPRPKITDMKSPILVAQSRFRPKRAMSLKDLDPDDFVIEHKSMLSNEDLLDNQQGMVPVGFGIIRENGDTVDMVHR